jgi:hypothetical protein
LTATLQAAIALPAIAMITNIQSLLILISVDGLHAVGDEGG